MRQAEPPSGAGGADADTAQRDVFKRCEGSSPLRLRTFYKKECQEKSSPSTGGREDFVSRSSPLHCKSSSRSAREVLLLSCLPFLWFSWSSGDHANRVLKLGKRTGI